MNPQTTEEKLAAAEARALAAEMALVNVNALVECIYRRGTRALAEPPDGTATLIEICTEIEALRAAKEAKDA